MDDIIRLIKDRSPFDADETRRIIRKFFARPNSHCGLLIKEEAFSEKKVLDIGCSYGQTLLHWGTGSEAIEVNQRMAEFVEALGRKVHRINVEDGMRELEDSSFDAAYANNLLEHLLSPHLFLLDLHRILKPHGILAVGHPVVPAWPFDKILALLGFKGWLTSTHIAFFSPRTARLTLERAGFLVKRQYFSPLLRLSAWAGRIKAPFATHCLSVCRRIDGFKYPEKRSEIFDPSWASRLKHFR